MEEHVPLIKKFILKKGVKKRQSIQGLEQARNFGKPYQKRTRLFIINNRINEYLQGEDAKNNTLMISLKTGLQLIKYFGTL